MAGDWLKVEETLPDKPEVIGIADRLGLDQDAVVGKLLRLWIWAGQQTVDGCAVSATETFVDRLARVPEFAKAMQAVGWLRVESGRLVFPNFDHHNGETAKKRALSAKRMAKVRAKEPDKSCAPSATKAQPEKRREELEKSKEEVKSQELVARAPGFRQPTLAEVVEYCRERNSSVSPERFVDHYTANGWRVGKTPMRDWKAAVRNWERNEHGRNDTRRPGTPATGKAAIGGSSMRCPSPNAGLPFSDA